MPGKKRECCLPAGFWVFAPHVMRGVRNYHAIRIPEELPKLAINELMNIEGSLATQH